MLRPEELIKALSELRVFMNPKPSLEQYPTDPKVAAHILYEMHEHGDLVGKCIGDLGCGTGILGIGALLLGAAHVTFIDIDEDALKVLKKNIEHVFVGHGLDIDEKCEVLHEDLQYVLNFKFDAVIMNPPFGVQKEFADRVFLTKAMDFAPVVYGLFKHESIIFVTQFVEHYGFFTECIETYPFLLENTMDHHTKTRHTVDVSLLRLHKEF